MPTVSALRSSFWGHGLLLQWAAPWSLHGSPVKLAVSMVAGKWVRRIFFRWKNPVWPGYGNEFCFGSENTTCLHTANVFFCGCKSINISTDLCPQVCHIWGNPRNLESAWIFLHSSNSLDFYLRDTFHVSVAFALSPDFGSLLSKKAGSLPIPAVKRGHTERGSNHIPTQLLLLNWLRSASSTEWWRGWGISV